MIYFVEIDPGTGRVLFSGSADALEQLPDFSADRHKISSIPVLDVNGVYWDGVDVRIMPPRPSSCHQFDYAAKQWVCDLDYAWEMVRHLRHQLMLECDWVSTRSRDLGVPVPPDWAAYRQALRDITNQPDPLNIVWPVAPES